MRNDRISSISVPSQRSPARAKTRLVRRGWDRARRLCFPAYSRFIFFRPWRSPNARRSRSGGYPASEPPNLPGGSLDVRRRISCAFVCIRGQMFFAIPRPALACRGKGKRAMGVLHRVTRSFPFPPSPPAARNPIIPLKRDPGSPFRLRTRLCSAEVTALVRI